MRFVSFEEIASLNISPRQCVEWASEAIRCKKEWILPEKTSIKFGDNCFFNTMPCLYPAKNIFGVKEVSRIVQRSPALKADILLYDIVEGKLLSFLDGTWITTMRTGAVAAISMDLLKKTEAKKISFIGLGNTARATLLCYDALCGGRELDVSVLAYKNQHEDFIERFKAHENIHFEVHDDVEEMIGGSDIVVSCVTATDSVFAPDSCYRRGVLVVPVHTRGFQNCDLFFDKVFCDDIPHISGFRHFKRYKSVTELTDIIPPPPLLSPIIYTAVTLENPENSQRTPRNEGRPENTVAQERGGSQMTRESLLTISAYQYRTYTSPQRFWSWWSERKPLQRNFGCDGSPRAAGFPCSCRWRKAA